VEYQTQQIEYFHNHTQNKTCQTENYRNGVARAETVSQGCKPLSARAEAIYTQLNISN
jgi:hypothetical protein